MQTEVDKIDDFPSDIEGQPIITSVTTEDPNYGDRLCWRLSALKNILHEMKMIFVKFQVFQM